MTKTDTKLSEEDVGKLFYVAPSPRIHRKWHHITVELLSLNYNFTPCLAICRYKPEFELAFYENELIRPQESSNGNS